MDILHPRCAGLDVHKDTVVAAVRCVSEPRHHEVRSFATTTTGLLALADWLAAHGCTHVAMEATGVYWKPVWHVLEADFTLILANAQHIHNVPGRKTDVSDAAWIADLLAHGLIRASFVPPGRIQALRDLTRTRKQLVREVAQHALRIQKVLEDANLKVASVLSNILGKSGRAMLAALLAGETDPERLAALARGTARQKHAALVEALRGHVTPHHRTLLTLHLQLVDALQAALAELEAAVGKALAPIRQQTHLLMTMPGISDTVAHVIVAEIGIDMTRFPSAAHLVSWAGLCPRNDESAGKRRSTRARRWRPLAQDHARHRRLGRGAHQGLVPPGAIPAPQGPPRRQEGHPRRRGLHARRVLPHAARRRRVPRPRRRSFCPPRQGQDHRPPCAAPAGTRL